MGRLRRNLLTPVVTVPYLIFVGSELLLSIEDVGRELQAYAVSLCERDDLCLDVISSPPIQ